MKTKQELDAKILRKTLPYGAYIVSKTEKVLHNRDYQPLWRIKNGKVDFVKPSQWIEFKTQEHFYDDSCPPWRSVKTYGKCVALLEEIGVFQLKMRHEKKQKQKKMTRPCAAYENDAPAKKKCGTGNAASGTRTQRVNNNNNKNL